MSWKKHTDPRVIGDSTIQYLRSAHHGHEGAHDVTVAGVTLRVLPDPHTTGRRRSDMIVRAVTTAEYVTRTAKELAVTDDAREKGLKEFDPFAYVVGYLITGGVRNLEIEGEPIHPRPAARGQWHLELRDDGTAEATFIGDAR